MIPQYDLEKIKFATDKKTFERAIGLYEDGRVTQFKSAMNGFLAVVLGGKHYRVFVSDRYYDRGNCECYLGQRDILCKHMVALAICAVTRDEPLSEDDKQPIGQTICSGRLGTLSKEELSVVKKSITEAIRHIKPYRGSSRIWFTYQDSLSEGCRRLSKIVSELPVSYQTAQLLVDLLLRLDKKLCYGVDDSDGTVGGFIREVVEVLQEFTQLDSSCIRAFKKLCGQETCFEWEESLVRIFDETKIK
jgi:hypothetical protein